MTLFQLVVVSLMATLSLAAYYPNLLPDRAPLPNVTLNSTDPSKNWSYGATTGWRNAWPHSNSSGHVTISYCFRDKDSKIALEHKMRQAIGLWTTALGGEASRSTSHSLEFKEFKSVNELEDDSGHCFMTDKNGRLWEWNQEIPKDALVVQLDNRGIGATVGWEPGNRAGRHQLSSRHDSEIWEIARGLGHVLGLRYEHQRPDRSSYVLFQCSNLLSYASAVAACRKDNSCNKQRLCFDYDTARKFGFAATEYITGPSNGAADSGGGFDIDSIMLFSSYYAAGDRQCSPAQRYPGYCPLTRFSPMGLKAIPVNKKPSELDAAFVKKFYPWIGGQAANGTMETGRENNTTATPTLL